MGDLFDELERFYNEWSIPEQVMLSTSNLYNLDMIEENLKNMGMPNEVRGMLLNDIEESDEYQEYLEACRRHREDPELKAYMEKHHRSYNIFRSEGKLLENTSKEYPSKRMLTAINGDTE